MEDGSTTVQENEKPRRRKPIDVTVIKTDGQSALVQYVNSGLQRVHVPAYQVVDGKCDKETLDAGIQYGLPFDELVTINVTPQYVAECLHAADIWSLDDIVHKPNAVNAALKRAYGLDLAALLKSAREYEGG